MKRLLTLSLALGLTLPVLAATRSAPRYKPGESAPVRRLSSDRARLPRLVSQLKQVRAGVGAAAVTDNRSSRLLVFPAAGNARGANGEFFRSDVTLISNRQTGNQELVVFWLRNGVDTDDPPTIELTLEPNVYYTFTDFVGTTLGRQNELGTIFIVPIDAAGDLDFENASLDGFSRIWTNQPGATGTVSQPFDAIDPSVFPAFEAASVMGLRQDAQYRTNYGLVNLDLEDRVFHVVFFGEGGTATRDVTVPAFGMVHQAMPAGTFGALVIEVAIDDPQAIWTTYGTSNDNITGDGWVSLGSGIFTPEGLDRIGF